MVEINTDIFAVIFFFAVLGFAVTLVYLIIRADNFLRERRWRKREEKRLAEQKRKSEAQLAEQIKRAEEAEKVRKSKAEEDRLGSYESVIGIILKIEHGQYQLEAGLDKRYYRWLTIYTYCDGEIYVIEIKARTEKEDCVLRIIHSGGIEVYSKLKFPLTEDCKKTYRDFIPLKYVHFS